MSNPYASPKGDESAQPFGDLATTVNALKGITVCTSAAALVVLGVSLAICEGKMHGPPDAVSWVALGVAVLDLGLHVVTPMLVARSALNNIDQEQFRAGSDREKAEAVLPALRMRHIVVCGMLLGGVIVNIVAYILTKYVLNVAAAAALILLIAWWLPSSGRVQFWVQKRVWELERR